MVSIALKKELPDQVTFAYSISWIDSFICLYFIITLESDPWNITEIISYSDAVNINILQHSNNCYHLDVYFPSLAYIDPESSNTKI